MKEVSAAEVKTLREETGAPVMDVRRALMETDGNVEEAKEILKQKGLERVEKRAEQKTTQGLIETYVHSGGKIGSMVHLACETDFAARTDEFKKLATEIAMQVAAMDPKTIEELLDQEYIRDPDKKVSDLVAEVIAKTGENVQVKRISRFSLSDQLK